MTKYTVISIYIPPNSLLSDAIVHTYGIHDTPDKAQEQCMDILRSHKDPMIPGGRPPIKSQLLVKVTSLFDLELKPELKEDPSD